MIIYSPTYPGLIKICDQCGCLFGYNLNEIYEEKYVYCPQCRHKIDSGVYEASWRFANERHEEAQHNDKETDSGGADSSSTPSSN